MAVRKIRSSADSANANTIANTTLAANATNTLDVAATVNAILACLVAHGLAKNS
jgi:hypothetical protein